MDDEEQWHALYRYRGDGGKRQPPLYIGRTSDPMRRTRQHHRSKAWITETTRIDVEWYAADEIAEVERQAIRREHPVYNIQHNCDRLRIEITAEVPLSPPSPESLAAMFAMIVAGGMAAVWLFDFLANWNVRRRAERAGMPVELPPPRNLFAQDPPHWSAQLIQSSLKVAAGELRRQEAPDHPGELTQGRLDTTNPLPE